MRKKHRLRALGDRIGRAADIDTFESFVLRMNAADELTIRGNARVRLKKKEEIALDYPDKSVEVFGKDLRLLVFSDTEAVIAGTVARISFLWGGK